jgi:hypothetical protein
LNLVVSTHCNNATTLDRHSLHRPKLIIDSDNFSIDQDCIGGLGEYRRRPSRKEKKSTYRIAANDFIVGP